MIRFVTTNRLFIPLIFIFFIITTTIVNPISQITVSPTGSEDQKTINDAITEISNNGGGIVYLNPGTYVVNGPVYIKSNVKLTGDSNAVIQVSSSSSQWFTRSTGIISCQDTVNNIEICGFQITGNCQNLNNNLANTPGHDKDCERCIILHGSSGNYATNIRIHDMTLYNSFSDGAYIYYAQDVKYYNNFVSNCQHEGIFWSVVLNGEAYGNKIAGITSDCMRLDNCVNCTVHDNILFSYNGTDNNGAYEHGENGIQIGDAGSSHGYDASNKPTTTTNIEVYNNTFANEAVILGTNSGNNVYVHDNNFIGEKELVTLGVSVKLLEGDYSSTSGGASVEQSETIFDVILKYLHQDYTYKYPNRETNILTNVSIEDYNNSYNPHAVIWFASNDSECVKYEYNGTSVVHYYSIDNNINNTGTDVWSGNLTHRGNDVIINEVFDKNKLSITCYNSNGYCKISSFNVTEIPDQSTQIVFNPNLWEFVGSMSILGIFTYRNLRRMIKL